MQKGKKTAIIESHIMVVKYQAKVWNKNVNLNSVIVGVGDDNVFVQTHAKSMGRVELATEVSKGSEFATDLHLCMI